MFGLKPYWRKGSRDKTNLVVLDDWGLAALIGERRRDLLELLDDRHGCRVTLVTTQLPIDHWHAAIGGRNHSRQVRTQRL